MGETKDRIPRRSREPSLTHEAASRLHDFIVGAKQLQDENPGADMGAINRFLQGYREIEEHNSRVVTDWNQKNTAAGKSGDWGPNPKELKQVGEANIGGYFLWFNQHENGKMADSERVMWEKYARKMQPPSIVAGATRQFFDDGLKIPGLIGGALGGYYIFNQMGGMSGGWLAFGAGLLAAVAGAWLTNTAVDQVSGMFSKGKEVAPPKVPLQQPHKGQGSQLYKIS